MSIQLDGRIAAEVAGLQAILLGVQNAAAALLCSPGVWPEPVRHAIDPRARLTVQVRRFRQDDAISSDFNHRGIWLEGVILLQRSDLGILGEGRNAATALAIVGALALTVINLAEVANLPATAGPNADLQFGGDVEIVNVGGEGKTDLAMLIPWRARTLLRIGSLLNDPQTSDDP